MQKKLIASICVLAFAITACTPNDLPAQAVENYYGSLINKDLNRAAALSCSDWEENAQLDFDSFQSINTTLENFACEQISTDGNTTLVNCKGQIAMSYNGENQYFDLSARTYKVINQNGEWLFCGYQ